MGLKPSAPEPPDYQGAAKAQGEANLNSSLATNYLNQVNQVGPNGSLTYSYGSPGQLVTPGSPAVLDKKGNVIVPEVKPTYTGGDGHYLPDGTFIPNTTATTTLSPGQQRLYDQNLTIGTNLNDLAIRGIDYVDDATQNPLTPGDFRGVSYGPTTLPTNSAAYMLDPNRNQTDPSGFRTDDGTGGLKYSYDFSQVGKMPSSSDFTADRDLVTQALLERMQPSLEQDRARLESQLANQGINLGSTAFSDAKYNQQRGVNDARIAALLAGSQEQQRLFGNAMGIRQQGVGEAINQGNFNNAAVGQAFSQRLGANDQNFRQLLGANSQNFDQYARGMGQNFQTDMAGNLQNFNMGLARAQFDNQALGQDVQLADYFQNQPLNVLNSLRTGNQVSMPQFQNAATGVQVAPAPIYAAANDQYQGALQAYQAQSGVFGSALGGLASLGGAAILASDRRLKENIQALGVESNGLMRYRFNYKGSSITTEGYIADEVEKLYPEAVFYDPSGYALVNYGRF